MNNEIYLQNQPSEAQPEHLTAANEMANHLLRFPINRQVEALAHIKMRIVDESRTKMEHLEETRAEIGIEIEGIKAAIVAINN